MLQTGLILETNKTFLDFSSTIQYILFLKTFILFLTLFSTINNDSLILMSLHEWLHL